MRPASLADRVIHSLQRHNPFYFLSAACMLAGILAVTNSLSWWSIPTSRLFTLIITLNCYEAALIGLAVYLIRRRNLIRDGVMLLVLEAFFLLDTTFLSAEIATSHPTAGFIVAAVLLLAAAVKLTVVARACQLPKFDGRFTAILLQIAALLALPVIFRWRDEGDLSARAFYAAWWTIGLLIPAVQFLCRGTIPIETPWIRRLVKFYLILPCLSLILHVSILHYVYDTGFYSAELTPILLALACLVPKTSSKKFIPRTDLVTLRVVLPAVALLCSAGNPAALCCTLTHHPLIALTPLRLAFAAAYLTYIYLFFSAHALYFLSAGAAVALIDLFGPSLSQWLAFAQRTSDWSARFIPKSAQDWGFVFIAAAFAFLGIGAAVSLKRRPLPTLDMPDIQASGSDSPASS